MKFFTRQWCMGKLGQVAADARVRAYWDQLDRLAARLPNTVYALGRGVNIHDGRFRSVKVARSTKPILLTVRCGDNQAGYFDLELRYGLVDFGNTDTTVLSRIVDDPECEALYDEVDVSGRGAGQRYVHRVICWPTYSEFAIVFRTLAMRLDPVAGRTFRRRTPVYREGRFARN